MRTAVVILNWNTKDFLERFLPGLSASMPEGAEVVVADNGSTDGSVRMVNEKFPNIKTLPFEKNYGFTGGYNRAFKALTEMPEAGDLEYFVLINSDIEVPQGWLEPLISWMDTHPDCAACAPKLHSWQDKESFEYAGAAGGLIDRFGYPFCRGRVLKRLEKDSGQYDTPAKVFWATGACLMVRAREYERMGGLDERFFAHMEEIDLCWRLQLEGKSIWVVPQSVVYHVGGGTLPNESPWKLKLNYRNNLLMLQNNLAKTYALREAAGSPADLAARKGSREARKLILFRGRLDVLSSLVYLFTGKPKLFKAVRDAHFEAARLSSKVTEEELVGFLSSHKGVEPPVLFPRWIIPLAMIKGNGIFEYLRKRI